ncbi:MAG: FKBP-type peptidyl-prolyl cis-trans isomerase [Prevotella sp.]
MNRIILSITLVFMAGVNFSSATAAKKKKVQITNNVADSTVIKLMSTSDTLSYSAGVVRTDGLIPYLKQQYGVDTTYIADFIAGYKEVTGITDTNKAKAYAAGQQIALMVKERMLPFLKEEFETTEYTINDDIFNCGFLDALNNDVKLMNDSVAKSYYDKVFKQMIKLRDEANLKQGTDFLAANKNKEGVITTASGLQYKVLRQGNGAIASINDDVTVKYEGRLLDGTVFDSSYQRNEDATFKPTQVIKGWTEALTMMPEGSKWELYIPQELAYGTRQMGKIKPCSTLVFTVEVVSVKKAANKSK